jgi:hypothetical protein
MELHVTGDFLDLHSFLLKHLEHNVGSITPVRVRSCRTTRFGGSPSNMRI